MMKSQATFYILAALVATALATTVAQMKNDIQTITSAVQTLADHITKLPVSGGSLLDVATIHTGATNLKQAMDKSTKNTQTFSGTVSESDGQDILNDFSTIESATLDSLKQIALKKDAMTKADRGFVSTQGTLSALQELRSSALALGSAFVAIAPANVKAQGSSITDNIDAGFVPAITTYST